MVKTPSTMQKLGTAAPDFELTDVVSGRAVSRDDFKDRRALLVMFICRHCNYVGHIREEIAEVGREYEDRDIGIVAISSNDPEQYPDDAPDQLREMARELDFRFPLCFDEDQRVAKRFRAACTPDFFLYNADRELVYRGQFDSSRPGNDEPVTGEDLRDAIDAVLAGKRPDPDQQPSAGCNIKWKPGNEPDYF